MGRGEALGREQQRCGAARLTVWGCSASQRCLSSRSRRTDRVDVLHEAGRPLGRLVIVALEHDPDAGGRVVAVDEAVADGDVARPPRRDRILRPRAVRRCEEGRRGCSAQTCGRVCVTASVTQRLLCHDEAMMAWRVLEEPGSADSVMLGGVCRGMMRCCALENVVDAREVLEDGVRRVRELHALAARERPPHVEHLDAAQQEG